MFMNTLFTPLSPIYFLPFRKGAPYSPRLWGALWPLFPPSMALFPVMPWWKQLKAALGLVKVADFSATP